jgi:FtsZ-interacting cell division protein YlmF
MEQADAAEGQRIRDFLRGAAYALGGDVRKVASRVYACVPAGVRIERLLSAVETGRQPQQARLSGGDPSDSEQGLWPE